MTQEQEDKKLYILEENKTVAFYSPLQENYVMTRTGTIPDGSCYFHSILHGCSKRYYIMNNEEKKKYVKILRSKLALKITKENWEELGYGIISSIKFQENISEILINFYKFILKDRTASGKITQNVINSLIDKDGQNLIFYKIMIELIPLEVFEKQILPKSFSNQTQKIKEMNISFKEQTIEYFDNMKLLSKINSQEKIDCLRKNIIHFINIISKEAEDFSFNKFKSDIKNPSKYVDEYMMGIISEYFDIDIYFIDGKNRMPYQNNSSKYIKNRKSIIILWVNDNHYEIIGILLPGNHIQRSFEPDHPIIKKINMFLNQPNDIKLLYPELIPFLPKNYKD